MWIRHLHRIPKSANPSRNDRHFLDRVDVRESHGDDRMTHLMMSNNVSLARIEQAVPLFRAL